MIRTPLSLLVAALAVGAIACTTFEPVDRGVCGNGLLEAGEDCDSSSATCVRCAVVCRTAADCPTTDHACGVDGVCAAPGGVLGPATVGGPFQVNDVAITDLDQDGIGDAVGVSRTSIVVRPGEPGGRLGEARSSVTPSQTGAAAFGDLDGDGALDATISTLDGLVAYGSRFGALSPLPATSRLFDASGAVEFRTVFGIDNLTIGGFIATEDVLAMAVFGFAGGEASGLPCGARLGPIAASAFDPALVDIYQVSTDAVVVAFVLGSAPRQLCVMEARRVLLGWTLTDITPPTALPVELAYRPVLANLGAASEPCPGLVNTDDGAAALRYWPGATSAGRCTLSAVAGQPTGGLLPAVPTQAAVRAVGRMPLSPGIFGLAPDVLVLEDGVWALVEGSGFTALFASQRRLASADHADIDGDGSIDGILIAATEDDLDILLRKPNALFAFYPGYIVYRIDTASRVVATEVADFDGNGRLDLAYLEQLADYQRVEIAYGTGDQLAPPVQVGALTDVLSFSHITLPDAEDIAAVTADLFVIQRPAAGETTTTLTLLSGSPSRTLLSYFDPRSSDGDEASDRNTTTMRAVVVGRFVPPAGRDAITIAVDTAGAAAPQVWRLPSLPGGLDATVSAGVPTSGLAGCASSQDGTGLCVGDALYLPWEVAPERDVVIAVDRSTPPHAVVFDPGAASVIAASPLAAITAALPADVIVRSLHAADLDGDGAAELVVSAAPRVGSQATGVILVCAVRAEGLAITVDGCEDVSVAIRADSEALGVVLASCVDAAPARLTAAAPGSPASSGARDLVVACRTEGSVLYRVHRGAAGVEVSVLARTATDIAAVRAGDVTGDGLDDVLALEGATGARTLVVFRQCSSRDIEACARQSGSQP